MTAATLRQHGLLVTTEPLPNGLTRICASYGDRSILAFDALWDLPSFAGGGCQHRRGCRRAGRTVRFVGDVPELRCWQHQ